MHLSPSYRSNRNKAVSRWHNQNLDALINIRFALYIHLDPALSIIAVETIMTRARLLCA
jgi:hypothetical protein